MQRLQNRQPIVYQLGTDWKTIAVMLDPNISPLTMTKMEGLRTVTSVMNLTMYYSDGVTQSESFNVQIDPRAKSNYMAGYVDRGKPIEMVFYEVDAG